MEENLNIDFHLRRMILKALNTTPSLSAATRLLGIPRRKLEYLIDKYYISCRWVAGEVENKQKRSLQSVAETK